MVNKKAQIWGMDLMIAAFIFTIGIVIFYFFSINSPNEPQEMMGNLFYEGEIIMNTILSTGSPENWNMTNKIKIGILDNHDIDDVKLEMFYNLTLTNYDETRILFNTKYDYIFFLSENMSIDSKIIEYIGKPGTNKDNINAENLIKITRFTSYKKKPTTAYLYIWRNY